eukprot:jgi/Undpi1/9632/HiC_scaffold_27.g12088.m1
MARKRMCPGSLLLSSLATILVLEIMLIGGVDSFATSTFCPSLGLNVNIKPADAAAVGAMSQGRRRLMLANRAARPASAAMSTTAVAMVAQRAGEVPPRCSALARSCTTTQHGHWFGALPLSRDSLDGDHGDGGGKGSGSGRGGGGSGGGDGGGDDESEGRRLQPEMLIAASGLSGALEGLKEALRNLRLPWAPQDTPIDEEKESSEGSQDGLHQELAKVMVADVVVEESVIPRDVLTSAAVKSGLLGREASAERIKACADVLNQWYQYEGYLLSSVSNAIISPNGTISFSVYEPVVSGTKPVELLFYKPKDAKDPTSELERVDKGKTRPQTIAKGLGMKGGEHFRVDAKRWRGVISSGLFNGAQLSGAHRNEGETGCTLDVNVEEKRTVVFEPGVTKTLFDSNWAGEVCFEEKNVLGRNTVLGLDMRRTMASPFTSFSLRLGNNRFGQPGAWQVSFFRDSIAPHSGFGGGGGYANNAIKTASSAPVFSTASPAGTPRDLGILARSIRSAHQGSVEDSGNSTTEAVAGGAGMSRCHGVSLSTSWPFSFVKATLGAGYQQVSSPSRPVAASTSVSSSGSSGSGGSTGGGGGGGSVPGTGKLDVFTLSGGLSKHWRLPGVLQRLGRWGGRRRGGGGGGAEAGGGGGYGGGGGAAEGGGELAGSVSSFVDVKTGCLLEGSAAPRPFTQELATLVHRVPVGSTGGAGSWNITLNVRQQVRGFAEGELGRAKEYVLTTAEVRVPLRNLLGKLSAQAVVFWDVSAFRPVTWPRSPLPAATAAASAASAATGLDGTRRAPPPPPAGGGLEGGPAGQTPLKQSDGVSPPALGGVVTENGEGGETSTATSSLPLFTSDGDGIGRGELQGKSRSPSAVTGGFRVKGSRGLGLRIADLIQVDVGISRTGMKQVHIGLVDRNY